MEASGMELCLPHVVEQVLVRYQLKQEVNEANNAHQGRDHYVATANDKNEAAPCVVRAVLARCRCPSCPLLKVGLGPSAQNQSLKERANQGKLPRCPSQRIQCYKAKEKSTGPRHSAAKQVGQAFRFVCNGLDLVEQRRYSQVNDEGVHEQEPKVHPHHPLMLPRHIENPRLGCHQLKYREHQSIQDNDHEDWQQALDEAKHTLRDIIDPIQPIIFLSQVIKVHQSHGERHERYKHDDNESCQCYNETFRAFPCSIRLSCHQGRPKELTRMRHWTASPASFPMRADGLIGRSQCLEGYECKPCCLNCVIVSSPRLNPFANLSGFGLVERNGLNLLAQQPHEAVFGHGYNFWLAAVRSLGGLPCTPGFDVLCPIFLVLLPHSLHRLHQPDLVSELLLQVLLQDIGGSALLRNVLHKHCEVRPWVDTPFCGHLQLQHLFQRHVNKVVHDERHGPSHNSHTPISCAFDLNDVCHRQLGECRLFSICCEVHREHGNTDQNGGNPKYFQQRELKDQSSSSIYAHIL
mmetsp:Transcript_269/g.907  ORF Transcript_269/g.907 Transcript_269/m.907 type:complete len:521 (+) Transcript_269:599-2161(+)